MLLIFKDYTSYSFILFSIMIRIISTVDESEDEDIGNMEDLTSTNVPSTTGSMAVGTTVITTCSIINLLEADGTTVTTQPESTGDQPGRGPFELMPLDETTPVTITVEATNPTSIMLIDIVASNVEEIKAVFKAEDGSLISEMTLTKTDVRVEFD